MGAYKRNDPELQEEEEAMPAPAGKRAAPKVHAMTKWCDRHKGQAPKKVTSRGKANPRKWHWS